MLPLGLLNAAQGHPMLVELKNGETLNGHLVLCDTWMNLTLREVVQTSPEGDKFVRLSEVYVKGNNIKYLRVPDEILDVVKDQQQGQGGGVDRDKRKPFGVPLGLPDVMTESSILSNDPTMHYTMDMLEGLVKSHWDTSGSALALEEAFKRIHETQLRPGSSFYHAALRLLAVHPDYLARGNILRAMDARGFVLTPEGKTSVALGLLRDGQYEMALDYLDEMMQAAEETPSWVLDIFIFVLARKGFLEEALQIMMRQPERSTDSEAPHTLMLWYFLLEECSAAFYYRGTKHLWNVMVESKRLHPSDGTVNNVLATASRHGDLDLAEQAIQVLSERSVKLGKQHYEALIDCYLECDDAENAFRVLDIMKRAAIVNIMESAKLIRHALERSAHTPMSLAELAAKLRKTSNATPEAEATLMQVLCTRGQINLALQIFQNSEVLQAGGPVLRNYLRIHDTLLRAPFLREPYSVKDATVALAAVEKFAQCDNVDIPDVMLFLRCYTLVGNKAGRSECLDVIFKQEKGLDLIDTPLLLDLVDACLSDRDPRAWDLLADLTKRDTSDSVLAMRIRGIRRKLDILKGQMNPSANLNKRNGLKRGGSTSQGNERMPW
ncbi:hypothetical protein QBC34DRAFT_317456 [Podospora aff. communis PSN243]|uniref:Sm domain-containing protein n=1 Tax=Podospora aff. communis PSN243 TaxID=3040156 RepID=A0AAV9H1V9_9PEZI|nr:hypothetical protein QBC34DRAFT_317456 [Podospora aff. communis PSN243]